MTTNQADDLTAETPKPRQVEDRPQKTAAKAKPKTTAKAGKTAAQSQPKGSAKKLQGTTRPDGKASSQAKAGTSSAAAAKPTARTSSRGTVKGARECVKEVSTDEAESLPTSQSLAEKPAQNLASKPSRKSVRKPEPKPTVQTSEPSTAFSSAKPVDRPSNASKASDAKNPDDPMESRRSKENSQLCPSFYCLFGFSTSSAPTYFLSNFASFSNDVLSIEMTRSFFDILSTHPSLPAFRRSLHLFFRPPFSTSQNVLL